MNNISGNASSWTRKSDEVKKEQNQIPIEVEEKINPEDLLKIKKEVKNSYKDLKDKMIELYSVDCDKKYHDTLIYLESIGSIINNMN